MRIADAWGTDQQDAVLNADYPGLKKISVDFAIMEPAATEQGQGERAHGRDMPIDWLDVGSWPALANVVGLDGQNNAVDTPLHVLLDSDNNIVVSHDPDHLIAMVGVSDMIVIHTPYVTMVCPRRDARCVKTLPLRLRKPTGPGSRARTEVARCACWPSTGPAAAWGSASSDEGGRFATPFDVLEANSAHGAMEAMAELILKEGIQQVVVGLPLTLDDSVGPAGSRCHPLESPALGAAGGGRRAPFVDERLSSFDAEQQLIGRSAAARNSRDT